MPSFASRTFITIPIRKGASIRQRPPRWCLKIPLFTIIDWLIRATGSDRLVLTGGAALNAVANMRLLEKFDEGYYSRVVGRATQLHLWVPPVPGDAGATLGAVYAFAASVGAGFGPPLKHAFYCGRASNISEIFAALKSATDLAWT